MLCSKCHCLKYTEKAFELVLREVCVRYSILYILNQLKLIHFSHVDSQLEHYVISAVAVQKLQLCYVFIVSGLTALAVRLVC